MKCVLTIAGSDSSGGAGIQADLKTMTCLGVYGMSAITALTAQNTTGVRDVLEATPEFVGEQLDCIFEDIRPQAVKIGMVSSAPIIRVIGAKLRQYGAENIVVDPVMGKHRGGPGDGVHQRLRSHAGQRSHCPDGGALPPGCHHHPQYSRGPAAVRLCH